MKDFNKRTFVKYSWFINICRLHSSDVVYVSAPRPFTYVLHGKSVYVHFYDANIAMRFRSPWILHEVINYCFDLYN